ncbi:hypothetical protein N431DRAFT_448354 [Stipitochalara longipes BDJ]|nr:hypothetical protein N431DRAFT_448354 [Stipitochalara longipes BDJ]
MAPSIFSSTSNGIALEGDKVKLDVEANNGIASLSRRRSPRSSTTAKTTASTSRSKVVAKRAARPCFIAKLAPEIILSIVENLDSVSSASFGPTCKAVYPIHFKTHGIVNLNDHPPGTARGYTVKGEKLANLLRKWFPSNLKYNHMTCKLIRQEDHEIWIEKLREEGYQQMFCNASSFYEGLSDEDYNRMTERWLKKADKMGWEYEERPYMRPTLREEERSLRWCRRSRGYGY